MTADKNMSHHQVLSFYILISVTNIKSSLKIQSPEGPLLFYPVSLTTVGSHTKYMLMILLVKTSENLTWLFLWSVWHLECFLHKNKKARFKRSLGLQHRKSSWEGTRCLHPFPLAVLDNHCGVAYPLTTRRAIKSLQRRL